MKRRYKVTIEVEDNGTRSFIAAAEFDGGQQSEFADAFVYEICKGMESVFQSPPNEFMFLRRMTKYKILQGIVALHDAWDTNVDFGKCLEVIVDVASLSSEQDEKDRANLRLAQSYGVKLKAN